MIGFIVWVKETWDELPDSYLQDVLQSMPERCTAAIKVKGVAFKIPVRCTHKGCQEIGACISGLRYEHKKENLPIAPQ
jgi:hypothetical protein